MIERDGIEERALLIRLREGEHAAFEKLYGQYKLLLLSNMLHVLKSAELAEEVLQDLFLKVWQNRENIDPDKSFRAYLFKISSNLMYDVFRKIAKDRRLQAHFLQAFEEAYTLEDDSLYSAEKKEELYKAIDLLPPQRRKVYVLCKLEEKSYKEVSEALSISTAAVNDHIRKANLFLKEHFRTELGIVVVVMSHAIIKGL